MSTVYCILNAILPFECFRWDFMKNALLAMLTGVCGGLAIGLSAFFQGKVAAASADALGETGKGTANYFIVIGIIETVALFTLVFSLLLLG